MSDVGERVKCGRWSDPREPTEEDQDILNKVKEQYVEKSGTIPLQFLAYRVRTQVAGGTNYLFEVEVGENIYKRLLVFVPQPEHLVAILPEKMRNDKLEDF